MTNIMKKILFPLLLVISLMVCSCIEKPVVDPDDPNETTDPSEKEDEQTGPQPGTYKFVASPLKEKWNAGDQVYVHGKLGAYAEVVTLTDISADGKTATAQLADVTSSLADPDGLYAAWPDEAVKHAKGKLGAKTSFSDCDRLMTVAYLQGDTFTFIDVSSALAFTVDGDYDRYALASNNKNGLDITDFEIEYTSVTRVFTNKQNSGYPYLYGSVTLGKQVFIWMPAEMSFSKGLTIFLGKGDIWTAVYSLTDNIVLETAKCRDLGNITAATKPYDGPAPIMPQITGKPTKLTVSLNELSGICLSANEDFLWAVGDEGDLARIDFDGKVLSTFHIGGDCEDISRNPETGDLLIGLEPQGVGVVKAPGFNARVTTLFNISACNNYGNSGVEGLAYYKDGKVFVGAQSNAHLFLCDLKTGKVEWSIKPWDKSLLTEVGGLCYDAKTGWLWVIDSEAKKVFVFLAEKLLASTAGTDQEKAYEALLGAYPVSEAANPESVCVDHKNACIWVGDDYGDISYVYRYDMTGLDDFIIDE